MGWIAEILRKDHRACERCNLGPTHVYDPVDTGEEVPEGTPLCTSCLNEQLTGTLKRFTGRGLLFEPALGPDALVFRGIAKDSPHPSVTRALDLIGQTCDTCSEKGQFAWVASTRDANLWDEDWLDALDDGSIEATGTMCSTCAAARITRSIETRGLYFEAIFPPGGSEDVVMLGSIAG